jgi:hypothetical protein
MKFNQSINDIQRNRLQDVNRYGSPIYSHICGIIALGANEEYSIESEFPQAMKYKPIDTTLIVNDSSSAINVILNAGMATFYIPAGIVFPIENTVINQVQIYAFGAVAAGEVVINHKRAAMSIDKLVQKRS